MSVVRTVDSAGCEFCETPDPGGGGATGVLLRIDVGEMGTPTGGASVDLRNFELRVLSDAPPFVSTGSGAALSTRVGAASVPAASAYDGAPRALIQAAIAGNFWLRCDCLPSAASFRDSLPGADWQPAWVFHFASTVNSGLRASDSLRRDGSGTGRQPFCRTGRRSPRPKHRLEREPSACLGSGVD